MIDSINFVSLSSPHGSLLTLGQATPPLGRQGTGTTSAEGATGGDTEAAGGEGGSSLLMFMFLPLILVMILFSVFGQRKERKKREALISSVKKHDRVRTIGGVIGAVVEIKPDTILLKVDESSNTRMTFARDAVQQVLEPEEESS
ncbi:MAG: preprotein translocase subunit YajC [Phycisphaerales bacterium]|jgi:preprotein translocase subunit YajC|nr:preprotein translocase subunit YajC [Phycisphaerales bacterium]